MSCFYSAPWIGNHGFSIGIDDVQPGKVLNGKKKFEIDDGYKKCNNSIEKYEKKELCLKPGANAAETLEREITEVLNDIRKKAGDVRIISHSSFVCFFGSYKCFFFKFLQHQPLEPVYAFLSTLFYVD